MAKTKLLFSKTLPDPRLIDLNIDTMNRRIIVRQYDRKYWTEAERQLVEIAVEANAEKIIVLARERDVRHLLGRGFVLEGTIDHFFKHEPVFYMSRFLTQKRREAAHWVQEDELLADVFQTEGRSLSPLSPQITLRFADTNDIPQLIRIYRQTFKTYPSPLTEPAYLKQSLEKNMFVLAEENRQVVSAAAAEINRVIQSAEITNCATDPSHRGRGLLSRLIHVLERELPERGIVNAYSIARARSFSMNAALHQLKYVYGGRLINNCTICMQPNPVTNPWETLIQGLQSKKYDAIIGSMTITDKRKAAVNFSNPYYRSGAQIFVAENNQDIKTPEDLKGKKSVW